MIDINKCAERILEENLRQYKKLTHIWGYRLRHIAKIVCGGVKTGQRITVYGYRRDVERFLKCFPKKNGIRVEYAESGQWMNLAGREFNNTKLVKKMASLETDKLIIVSEDLRYLLQMCMISEKVSYQMIDIYDLIKREYKFILEGGIYRDPFRGMIYDFLVLHTKFGKRRWKQDTTKYIDNYDAILVRKFYAKQADNLRVRRYYFEELIINYLLIRDFQNAFRYIDEYTNLYGEIKNSFIRVKQEFLELFELMKKELQKKEKKDIIVFWCDALPYEDFKEWKFLSDLEQESLSFENTYTHIPYTHTTSQAMFTGIPYFEGKMYKRVEKDNMIESGKLIDFLESNNYHICELHACYINQKYRRNPESLVKSVYLPGSMVMWNALELLLERNNEKNFIVCHMDCELHNPFWNGEADKLRADTGNFLGDMTRFVHQRMQSAAYLEKQIKYYLDFMNDNISKIFMSDHGIGTPAYLEKRLHAFCFVNDKNIVRGRYKGYFSFLNFYSLIYYILYPNKDNFEKIFSEYVLIQNDHPYSEKYCGEVLEKFKNNEDIQMLYWMGYRGIIKDGYKLIKFHSGEEKWLNIEDKEINFNDILDKDLVEFMRMRVGNVFPDIKAEEHYKNTKKLYEQLHIKLEK